MIKSLHNAYMQLILANICEKIIKADVYNL